MQLDPAHSLAPNYVGRDTLVYTALGVDSDGDDVVQDYAGFTDRETALRTAQRNFAAWGIDFVALMPHAQQ